MLTFGNKGSGFTETEAEVEGKATRCRRGVWIWWKKDVGLSLHVTVIKSLIFLNLLEKLNRSALIMSKRASLSPVILLILHALIPASFIKGQNGGRCRVHSLELIVIMAPDN